MNDSNKLDLKSKLHNDTVLVSTVLLPAFEIGDRDYHKMMGGEYETCIFFDDGTNSHSEVVERYDTRSDAITGHKNWCDKVLANEVSIKHYI